MSNPDTRTINQIAHNFSFHPANTEDKIILHEGIRASMCGLAFEMNSILPPSREAAIVQTKLEEAMFWANAAIAREVSGGA